MCNDRSSREVFRAKAARGYSTSIEEVDVAHIWNEDSVGGWFPTPVDDDVCGLVLRRASPSDDAWVLLGPPTVSVNGVPLDLGIHVLRHRDELRVGRTRAFFSAETLAAVEPFPGSEGSTLCPRCKLEIEAGKAAVRCPTCCVWHHQCPDEPERLGCWLYSEKCAADCGQPTALDAGFRWTPEDEL